MFFKQYLKYLGLSIFIYLVLALFFCVFLFQKNSLYFLDTFHFLRFDAILYDDIKTNGYHQSWLCAFFPAFPYLWKFLNLSAIGISLVNALIFSFSFSAIAFVYKMKWKQQLFFLTIPSFIFMFVPYTESLFFVAGTLLVIGLKQDKAGLILISLFLGSLIRPTTVVFIPAIFGAYYFAEKQFKQTLKKSSIPIIALFIGLFTTISIHYYFTGKWLVFFEAQKLWKNYLHFPSLPFISWGGDASNRYDGSALAIALFCTGYIFFLFSQKLKYHVAPGKDLVFSLLYIVGTAFLILMYRDGNLYSLNRFIYATPFIIIVLHYFFEKYEFKYKHVCFVLIASEVLWLLFNSYNHIHNLLLFSTVSVYFILILFSKHSNQKISTISFLMLIAINAVGIIKLSYRFLNNGWIG